MIRRSTSDFLSADIDGSPKPPSPPASDSYKEGLIAQVTAVYHFNGPAPVVFANRKFHDLSLELIAALPEFLSVHQKRQMELALTDLERAKDAAAKAYMLR
jgi:hypothetical protein